jgi:hypothetical protein
VVVRAVRVLLLVTVAMLVGAACRIDARVDVRVNDDGSGLVRVSVVLDPEAVRAAEARGSTLESQVRLDDLPAAGWTVAPWSRRSDGGARLSIRRPFSSPEQLSVVMAELNGPDGPLRGVRLRRSTDPVRTTFDFRALADLAGAESGVVSDAELAANLSAQRVYVTGLDAALTAQLRDALRMRVAVALPGAGTRVWRLAPGTRTVLETDSSQLEFGRFAWIGAGVVLGAAAWALLIVGERRRRKVRRGPERSRRAVPLDP